jgi:hypothetical protein
VRGSGPVSSFSSKSGILTGETCDTDTKWAFHATVHPNSPGSTSVNEEDICSRTYRAFPSLHPECDGKFKVTRMSASNCRRRIKRPWMVTIASPAEAGWEEAGRLYFVTSCFPQK